jgi:ElaA protein
MMTFITKKLEELSAIECYDLLQLRSEVFVIEQHCIYADMDDIDKQCLHVLVYSENTLIACARLLSQGLKYDTASIGRVATKLSVRKTGIGKKLMLYCIEAIHTIYATNSITISAQYYLVQFYQAFGFYPVGEIYEEDEIPHIKMCLN